MGMSLDIDGHALRYEIRGLGPPLLFVHGFPLSGRLWRPVVEDLAADHRCIVPDLRGHGGSEPTPEATMGDYAEDLVRLLDGLDETQPVVLLGMSMGGYVAFEFCRRYPERVRALVLTNTRAEADTAEAARGRRETAGQVQQRGSAVVAEAMTAKLFGPGASQELKTTWREIMSATLPAGVVAALKAMASRPASFDTLASLGCPVLIIAGAEDAITPPADSERMHQAAPESRLEIIPGSGHMTAVEKPGEFVAVLRSFLADDVKLSRTD